MRDFFNKATPPILSSIMLACSGWALVATAQDQTAMSSSAALPHKQTTRRSLSDVRIMLRLTFPGRTSALAAQREGGLIRVEVDGAVWGLTPIINDAVNQEVSVAVFRMQENGNDSYYDKQDLFDMKQILVTSKHSDSFAENMPFGIGLEAINLRVPHPISDRDVSLSDFIEPISPPEGGGGKCCVICNGVRVCACWVQMDCGECCLGDCC